MRGEEEGRKGDRGSPKKDGGGREGKGEGGQEVRGRGKGEGEGKAGNLAPRSFLKVGAYAMHVFNVFCSGVRWSNSIIHPRHCQATSSPQIAVLPALAVNIYARSRPIFCFLSVSFADSYTKLTNSALWVAPGGVLMALRCFRRHRKTGQAVYPRSALRCRFALLIETCRQVIDRVRCDHPERARHSSCIIGAFRGNVCAVCRRRISANAP